MNAPVNILQYRAETRYGVIDCDIHPFPKPGALNKYLSERWRNHVAEYGQMTCGIYAGRGNYPRFQPYLSRRDSFPPDGGPPGSDVDFIRQQLLDPIFFFKRGEALFDVRAGNLSLSIADCLRVRDLALHAIESRRRFRTVAQHELRVGGLAHRPCTAMLRNQQIRLGLRFRQLLLKLPQSRLSRNCTVSRFYVQVDWICKRCRLMRWSAA